MQASCCSHKKVHKLLKWNVGIPTNSASLRWKLCFWSCHSSSKLAIYLAICNLAIVFSYIPKVPIIFANDYIIKMNDFKKLDYVASLSDKSKQLAFK